MLVEINNQWVEAIVVDDGLGKKRISVILRNDNSLTLIKVPTSKVKAFERYEWPFETDLGKMISQENLCRATVHVFT